MQADNEDPWPEIARAWVEGVESVAAIAKRHRLFPARIYTRAKAEDWPARGGAAEKPKSLTRPAGSSSNSKRAPVQPVPAAVAAEAPHAADVPREVLLRRLFGAIDLKLKQLEKRMSSGKAVSAADSERQTRELNQMIRSFEMVTELARDRDNAAVGAAITTVSATDAERMRREIAERLERLARGRQPRG